MKGWHPGWVFAGAVLEAGVIMTLNDWKATEKIQGYKLEGAAFFKRQCERNPDLDEKAREIMQLEMDKILDKAQGRSR